MIKNNHLAFTLLGVALLSNTVFAATSDDIGVRLPAITSYWKTEEDSVKKATISMEEINKCIGNDTKIRQQYDAYKEASDKMTAESAELEKQVQKLIPERDALSAESTLVNAEIATINNKNSELEKDRVEINALSTKKLDAAGAKNANLKINAFNAKVNQFNAEQTSLKSKIEALRERQSKFMAIATPLKDRSDAFNEKVLKFKNQQTEFESMIASYKDKCTGSREITK